MEIKRIYVYLRHETTTTGRFPGNINSKTMRAKTTIYDFDFRFVSYGRYKVTYTSPVTGKKWTAQTTDMPLIDATKNSDEPKRKDLDALKWICKNG